MAGGLFTCFNDYVTSSQAACPALLGAAYVAYARYQPDDIFSARTRSDFTYSKLLRNDIKNPALPPGHPKSPLLVAYLNATFAYLLEGLDAGFIWLRVFFFMWANLSWTVRGWEIIKIRQRHVIILHPSRTGNNSAFMEGKQKLI